MTLNQTSGLQFASLGSGSRGNATLFKCGTSCLLVDCGFTLKQTLLRLARLGVAADELSAILVTHEHSDHIQGVAALAIKFDIPVFCSHGTAQERRGRASSRTNKRHSLLNCEELKLNTIHGEDCLDIDGFRVQPVSVPHDAREPLQYIVGNGEQRIGLLTDIGHVTPHVESCYAACDALLVESNHDTALLLNSAYPQHLIRRVGGLHGHLSNEQTAQFLALVSHPSLQHVVIAHMSEQNNHIDCVREALQDLLPDLGKLTFASQENGTGWIELEPRPAG